jgi:hypothetical protein
MQRILIRHISGTRANQVDEFSADGFKEIVAGRDDNANVRFDPEREDLVSRQHVRVYPDPANAGELVVTDLGSRNGTFVNKQRISAPMRIRHGDAIQLGAGGPEFRVEFDPPPANATASRPTRVAASPVGARVTRVGSSTPEGPRPIGRATVERMLDDTFGKVKRESGKTLWAGIAAVVMIGVLGVGSYFYLHHSAAENAKRLEDQQLLLLQMAQVVKRQPSDDAAVKAQMERLSTQMKQIMAQNVALEKAAASQDNTAQTSSGQGGEDYDSGLTQATNLYKSSQFQQAYAECVRITQIDPSRWEGHYIAGLSAEALNSPQNAQQEYGYALSQAPDSAKETITSRLSALQGVAQQQAN